MHLAAPLKLRLNFNKFFYLIEFLVFFGLNFWTNDLNMLLFLYFY